MCASMVVQLAQAGMANSCRLAGATVAVANYGMFGVVNALRKRILCQVLAGRSSRVMVTVRVEVQVKHPSMGLCIRQQVRGDKHPALPQNAGDRHR